MSIKQIVFLLILILMSETLFAGQLIEINEIKSLIDSNNAKVTGLIENRNPRPLGVVRV